MEETEQTEEIIEEKIDLPVIEARLTNQNVQGQIIVMSIDIDLEVGDRIQLVDEENIVEAILEVKTEQLLFKPDWETWYSPSGDSYPLPTKEVSSPQADLIKIEEIELLDNPRGDVGDVSELAESIRVGGLLHPVVVRKTTEGSPKPYQLVVGYRRYNAHLYLERKQIPAIIHKPNSEDILANLITENLQRKGWTAIAEASAMQRMVDVLGYSQAKVAAVLGIHPSQVSRRLNLLKLPPKVKDMVSEGDLSASHAEVLMSLKQVDSQEEMAELAAKSGASVSKLNSWTQKVREQEIEQEQVELALAEEIETTGDISEDQTEDSDSVEDQKEEVLQEIKKEAFLSEKDPIAIQSFAVVTSLPALELSDWDDLQSKKALLYLLIRSANDVEIFQYLEEEHNTIRENLWGFVTQASEEQLKDMIKTMTRRWFKAAHRFPTFPEDLKEELSQGVMHIPPQQEHPEWEEELTPIEWDDDWEDD